MLSLRRDAGTNQVPQVFGDGQKNDIPKNVSMTLKLPTIPCNDTAYI